MFVCLWHVPHPIVLWLSRIYGMNICMYVLRGIYAHIVGNDRSCVMCKKSYTCDYVLKWHVLTHRGERLFLCNVCEKLFRVQKSLTVRKRIHSGECPFLCDVCKKSFSVRSNFKRHLHTYSGKLLFSCEVCKKSFTRLDTLKIRTSTHIQWVVSVSVWHHNMILNHSYTCVACGDSIGFVVKSAIFLSGVHKNAAHPLYNMKWDEHKNNWNCTFLCDVYRMSFSMLSYLKGICACGMGNALSLVLCIRLYSWNLVAVEVE